MTTTGMHGSTAKAVGARLRILHAAARRFGERPRTRRDFWLPSIVGKDDLLAFVTERLERRRRPRASPRSRSWPTRRFHWRRRWRSSSSRRSAARLAARKRAAGLYDFDDMLTLVNEALAGPRGTDLIATLRQRYRLAVVDEFQDTDQIQWEIFETIFDERRRAAPLSGRRSEAGDLRISRRRRGDLRRGAARPWLRRLRLIT